MFIKCKLPSYCALIVSLLIPSNIWAKDKKNVILIMADDISAREFPIYGSNEWDGPRAKTPVLDEIATGKQGCYVKTCWSAPICKPSRTMIMTGRYAYQTKWWYNGDFGKKVNGEVYGVPEGSPMNIGHVSRDAGYANIWVSKTHITWDDTLEMGFNEGVFSPGEVPVRNPSPYPSFKKEGQPDAWDYESFYWWPEIQLVNHPDHPESILTWLKTDISDYAPDIELNYIQEFIDRQVNAEKPFFVYYTPHLGHTATDYMDPEYPQVFTGTPVIEWDEKTRSYSKKKPSIKKNEDGSYTKTNITPQTMKSHVEYLDYQVWLLIEQLRKNNQLENTVIILTADNATQPYAKGTRDMQRSIHVPLYIYAPGETEFKNGEQDILIDFTDFLPTLAEIMNYDLPDNKDYKIDGKSFWTYLTGKSDKHREWIHSFSGDSPSNSGYGNFIRNHEVLKDANGDWWDVRKTPADIESFTKIDDISDANDKKKMLEKAQKLALNLAPIDNYKDQRNAPKPELDSNKDGMPDSFEKKFGDSDLTASKDSDKDGLTNYMEYIYGTNPIDAKSSIKPEQFILTDAQGKYVALKYKRRRNLELGHRFIVEGKAANGKWTRKGIVNRNSVKPIPNTNLEEVTARVLQGDSVSPIKELRLNVSPLKYN